MSGMKIPEDEEQRNIIDKLANFVARNGPKFEELTKSKQRENEKFAFLFGGEYHSYYNWKVSLERTQVEAQKRIQGNTPQSTPGSVQASEEPAKQVTTEFDLNEFQDLLQKIVLACTKDNIQNGKNWIVNNCKTDHQLKSAFQLLLWRMLEEVLPFQQKLHIVYLANDILHHSRKKDLPQLLESLQIYILPIVAITHNGESAENQGKLSKVLKIWDNQKFFTDVIRERLSDPNSLYDTQLDIIDREKGEIQHEKRIKEEKEKEEIQKEEQKRQAEIQQQQQQQQLPPQQQQLPQQQPPTQQQPRQGFGMFQRPPPQGFNGPPQGQFHQFEQWRNPRPPLRPPNMQQPDPYHFYGGPPRHQQPHFDQPRPGFPPFQQGFGPPRPGPPGQEGPGQQGYPPFEMQPQQQQSYQPPPQVQTFDYSHQSVPGIDQGGGAPPAPVTFDYEHGRAPVPDGAKPMEDVCDPTIPLATYHDLPAGLMVPLVKLWDCEYKPLDPKDLRLPIPQPPSERLLAAVEAFYAPPSHDRPRDSQGWEKNGLFEFFKAKLKYMKDKERKIEIIERSPSPPPSPGQTPEYEGSPLVKDAPPRSRSASKSPPPQRQRSRSRSRSRERQKRRSRSKSRSRSTSRSPGRRRSSRSCSRSRSRSKSRSRSPIRRSPTPPEGFLGFETRSLDSRIDESNVGHQLLKKMGWGGQGLGKQESGIVDPIKQGEVRDRQDKFKGVGVDMNDPFDNYRKNKSYTYSRPRKR